MTILVEITNHDVEQDIVMPGGSKNSVVEIVGDDTPDVVAGGVDAIAEAQPANSGETVTIKLSVEKKEAPEDKTEIDAAAQGKTVELYLDLSLTKTVISDGSTVKTPISDTEGRVLAIVVPFDFADKTGVTVYRKHGESAAALTELTALPEPPADGTFYADRDNGRITIYTDKFSTYAIACAAPEQATYTLTVNGGTGSGSYAEGAIVEISAIIPYGKWFTGWTGADVENPNSISTTLVMPAQDTTVTANFQYVSNDGWSVPVSYPVETPSVDGGEAVASRSSASSGTTVTLTMIPDQGYEIGGVTVTDKNGKEIAVTAKDNGKYSFVMPNGKVIVLASFVEIADGYKNCHKGIGCPLYLYPDTDPEAWYHDGIHYCMENGLMEGYEDGLFKPDEKLSRAQFVQILFNKAGRPVVNYLLPYEDVETDAWYTEAVRWAASQGIASGSSHFNPNAPITREQLFVMLWRYAGSPAATEKQLHFTDADEASDYALEALRWAVENGIIYGSGNGKIEPQTLATRAQVAQLLKSYLEK